MTIGYIGTDHTRASLALRERLVVADERLNLLLEALRTDPLIAEAAVLSTCNRTEVYVAADDARAALARAAHHLHTVTGVPSGEMAGALESRGGTEAVRHLCAVAAGLCSLVRGETQILTQVREAFEYAAARDAAGPELQALARGAVRCGKRVRAETALCTTDTSVSAVAVETAARRLGGLQGRAALLIGAGRINEVAAHLLRDAGIGSLTIASRTHDAAAGLAALCGGRAATLADLPALLAEADLVITATRSPEPLVTPRLMPAREPARPLLIVDIAVPRDVDPAVGALPGVALIDLDSLRASTSDGDDLLNGVTAAWVIVDECVEGYEVERRTRRAVPLIAQLRDHVDRQKDAELARTLAGLEHLAPDDRHAVEQMAHRLVNRMFHHLATRMKLAAAEPDADAYLAALSFLFDGAGTEYRTVTAPEAEMQQETLTSP